MHQMVADGTALFLTNMQIWCGLIFQLMSQAFLHICVSLTLDKRLCERDMRGATCQGTRSPGVER